MFPLFVVIALLVRNRTAGIALASASAVLMALLAMQFSSWYWVS